MEHKLRVTLFLFCILNLICLSAQYGQLWVDEINPAKTDEVHFTSLTSENANVGDLNVQTLAVSHPEGLIVKIPGSLDFGGSSHTVVGELGVILGHVGSEALTFTSGGSFTSLSQVVGINTDDAFIRGRDDVVFQSTRGVAFRSDFFNLDGVFGTIIKSEEENVEISSGVEITAHSEKVLLAAENELLVRSQSGSVEISSNEDVVAEAGSIFLQGLLGAQVVARGSIEVLAEDLFQGQAATSSITSLISTTLTSPQNVDFTAQDTILFNVDETASVTATTEVYVGANGDADSSVTVNSATTINIDAAETASFSGFKIQFDAIEQHITTSSLTVHSTEKFSVGSDATNSVYISSEFNNVVFSLSDGAYGDLGVESFLTQLNTTTSTTLDSSSDIKVVATNIKSHANDITFTADTFTAHSLTPNGRLIYTGQDGTALNAGENVNIAARDAVFIGTNSISNSAVNDIHATFAQIFSVNADEKLTLSGGVLTVNGHDVVYDSQADLSINGGDISINTVVGDIYFASTAQQSFDLIDATFVSNRGDILINADESILFQSTAILTFNATDDQSFIAYGDKFNIISGGNLIYSLAPESDGVDGLASFSVGLDFDFTAPSYYLGGDDVLLTTGFRMSLKSTKDSELTAPEILFKTFSNNPSGGIYLNADENLSFSSGENINLDSSSILSLSAEIWNWITNSFTMASSQQLTFGSVGGNYINATQLLTIHSDNDASFRALDEIDITSFQALSFNAEGDISVDGSFNVTAFGDITYTAGDIIFSSFESSSFSATGDFNVTATNPGSSIDLSSEYDVIEFTASNWTFTTENLSIDNEESFYNNAAGDIDIQTENISLDAREFNLNAGNFSLEAGSIEFGTDSFLGTYTASSAQLTVSAGDRVALTSEGDITWNVPQGDVSVTTPDLVLKASNSEAFISNLDINFLAVRDENDINVKSGGGTQLIARDGDVLINSDNDMLWKAQRSLIFRTNEDGIYLLAEDGNFSVDSAASILYEASDSVDLIAYNRDGTASASFLSEKGMLLQSDRNGISFKSQGFVPDSNDGILIESTAVHGDVIFTTNDGEIFMTAPGAITYTSTAARINLVSAYDSTFTSLADMSFSAPNGGFNFDANTGVEITAGNPGNVADLNILQPKSFYSLATSQINIESLGPVVGNAIEIKSNNGSVQFITADVSDIYLYASNDQTFNTGGNFKIDSNQQIQSTTPGGPIIFQAKTNGQFITEGGPIQLSSQTGSSSGHINIDALTKDITFDSGNSIFFTAKQEFDLTAQTGISIDSADGDFHVAANSATSVIEANAAGYIQIISTGTRKNPYDGVYLEAANNVEIGTVTTNSVSFNAVNYFIIGDVTRPIVTINAGGSPTVAGITITSDGQISTATENNLIFDITGELIYAGSTSITSYSRGPSNIISTGNGGVGEDITLSANLGTIKLEGDFFSLDAPNGITSTTSGNINIKQLGETRNNNILMQAPLVTYSADGDMLWLGEHIDADLTSTYSLTTPGHGSIISEGEGSLFFRANSLFTILSGDILTFTSERTYGQIDFTATGAGSTITLETGFQSSIDVSSSDAITIFGRSVAFTGGDKITFEAQDAIPNVNAPNGDIAFYTTGSINVTSQADVSFGTNKDVNIQTTSFSGGLGFDITFLSTDELEIDSVLGISISNVYNEGGIVEFKALSDISIENAPDAAGKDQVISFTADDEFEFSVARDYTLNILNDGFSANVGGDGTFIATGIDSVDDFGIQFITKDADDAIDFRSLFGDVTFEAESVTIAATLNARDSSTSSMNVRTKQSSSVTAQTGDFTINAGHNILSETRAGSTFFHAENEFLVATSASDSFMRFTSNGANDNGHYAIKYEATHENTPVVVSTLFGDLNVESTEALVLQGDYIDLSSRKAVEFISNYGDILVEAQLAVEYFTYSNLEITSQYSTEFITSGFIKVDSDGSVNFNTDDANIDIRTTATDANIDMQSSGSMEFDAGEYFTARSAAVPGGDVIVSSTLGFINIEALDTNPGVTLNLLAAFGDLEFIAFGDDADLYLNSDDLDIQVDGDFAILSTLGYPGPDLGIDIQIDQDFTIVSEDLTYVSYDFDLFVGDDFNLESSQPNGGGIVIFSEDGEIDILSDSDFSLSVGGQESTMLFESAYYNIEFFGFGDNIATIDISSNSIMKIPNNDYKGSRDIDNECIPGEFFVTSNVNLNGIVDIETSNTYVCTCTDTHDLRCVPFRVPPYQRRDMF